MEEQTQPWPDSTEEISLDDEMDEQLAREEIRCWLEMNGHALFKVEFIQWMAKEAKRNKKR